MPSVTHYPRCFEKHEIPIVSKFNEIRLCNKILRDDSNGKIHFVIRDLENSKFSTEIAVFFTLFWKICIFPEFYILPILKEFHPEIPHTYTSNHMHMQPYTMHAYKLVILSQTTKQRTFILKQERITSMHHVLAFLYCLLHSSVLPLHLH